MEKFNDWDHMKNILCVRLDNMGDVIMTSPAFQALKESVPERKLTLLTSSSGKAIAHLIPNIDKIIVFDTPWVKNTDSFSLQQTYEMVELLKQEKFDGAIIFTVYSQNPLPAAMLCYLAGIPRVLGYCRENPYKLMSDWVPEPEPLSEIKHEVIRQLDLVAYTGSYTNDKQLKICLPEYFEHDLNSFLDRKGISGEYIVLHPGASEEKRMFSLDILSETALLIAHDLGLQVVVTGSSNEENLGYYIDEKTNNKVINLCGELNLTEFIFLIKNAKGVISNNTGTVHVAAATQTPVVVLYALTNPQHAPWMVPHVVLPFDVPKDKQSRNAIIQYAYTNSFINEPEEITPEKILSSARQLIKSPREFSITNLVQT